MLGKLLKYEMKASARTLIPLYIGMLIVAGMCSLTLFMSIPEMAFNSQVNTWMAVFYLLFFALCVATVVLTAMVIVQRFNKSLIGDEGYLMFTLPVTHTQLLFSKLITAILWVLAGSLVMLLSGVIIGLPVALTNADSFNWASIWVQLSNILHYTVPYFIANTVTGFFSIAATILMVYLSIMVAQTERFNQHRVAVAVVLFFLISWAFGAVENILIYGGLNAVPDILLTTLTEEAQWTLSWFLWAQALFMFMQCIICFCGTKWLMQKKLNL